MISATYLSQVDLLLQVLPHVAKEERFALKSGTAINLFVRNMPRLSVDIDLTWLPFDDRATAMAGITDALKNLKVRLENAIPDCKAALSLEELEARFRDLETIYRKRFKS